MPKVNVYLSDELAAAVRSAGLSISPICQRALEEEIQLVGAVNSTIKALRSMDFDPLKSHTASNDVWNHTTTRLRKAVDFASQVAGLNRKIETKHLLIGLIDEGDNLAIRLLRSAGIDVDELRQVALTARDSERVASEVVDVGLESDQTLSKNIWLHLSDAARHTFASALENSVEMGHHVLGCEHVLLGLLDTEGCEAQRVLQAFSIDAATTRRSVVSAIAGYAHAKAVRTSIESHTINDLATRLSELEDRVNLAQSR